MEINHKRTIIISLIILLFILISAFLIFKTDEKIPDEKYQNKNMNISNLQQEDLSLGAGYGLQLKKLNSTEKSQSNGQITLESPQNQLEVTFNNRGKSGNYILKIF